MKLRNDDINNYLERVKQSEKELELCVLSIQTDCKHKDIAECDYSCADYRDTSPPIRICLDCGITEEGWGCGYRTLIETDGFSPRVISRENLYKLRIGKFIRQ